MSRVLYKIEVETYADNAQELTELVFEHFAWIKYKIEMLPMEIERK